MKKYILILLAVLIFCSTQHAQAQANPRYQIHETATTKKYVIRGGVTWMGMFSEGFAIVGKEGGYSRPKSFFVIDVNSKILKVRSQQALYLRSRTTSEERRNAIQLCTRQII